MEWYYVENSQQKGPVEESVLLGMKATGACKPDTLVWSAGMSEWQSFATAFPSAPEPIAESFTGAPSIGLAPEPAILATCSQCGMTFPQDQMVPYAGKWICAECKPLFFQRIQQGSLAKGAFEYGGFWIRFGGKFLDGIIQQGVAYGFTFLLGLGLFGGMLNSEGSGFAVGMFSISAIFGYLFPLAYTTFFLGRFGATPGKMACGLRVIRPNGDRITYMRAAGRHLAEYVSGAILMFGYIMAASDEEKRALHDRMCDTRVVRK